MTDPELNAAVAEHVAKLRLLNRHSESEEPEYAGKWFYWPMDAEGKVQGWAYIPDYVNDPAAVLELLHQEGGGWSADDQWMTPPNSEPVRYAVCIGKSRGFGPTFHRAAIRALLRAHGVHGVNDRDLNLPMKTILLAIALAFTAGLTAQPPAVDVSKLTDPGVTQTIKSKVSNDWIINVPPTSIFTSEPKLFSSTESIIWIGRSGHAWLTLNPLPDGEPGQARFSGDRDKVGGYFPEQVSITTTVEPHLAKVGDKWCITFSAEKP